MPAIGVRSADRGGPADPAGRLLPFPRAGGDGRSDLPRPAHTLPHPGPPQLPAQIPPGRISAARAGADGSAACADPPMRTCPGHARRRRRAPDDGRWNPREGGADPAPAVVAPAVLDEGVAVNVIVEPDTASAWIGLGGVAVGWFLGAGSDWLRSAVTRRRDRTRKLSEALDALRGSVTTIAMLENASQRPGQAEAARHWALGPGGDRRSAGQ